ncbi:MAG: hypothetical protein WBA93_09240 [Microcoleaceae cyanobacterium]
MKSQTNSIQASCSSTTPEKIASVGTKRMSVTLTREAREMLEFLADSQGISQNEALRKAIATEAYFQKQIKQGSTVLVMDSNKSMKEVVFR